MENEIKLEHRFYTIYDAVKNIKNGKWVIPSFQRSYVWRKDQVEKLWDSILTGYPISTFLFWEIDEKSVAKKTLFYSFVDKAEFRGKKTYGLRPEKEDGISEKADIIYEKGVSYGGTDKSYIEYAVLDGQQRLTSIYLSLLGECSLKNGKQNPVPASLYVQLDEDEVVEDADEDGLKSANYSIKFMKDGCHDVVQANGLMFKLKDILCNEYQDEKTRMDAIEEYVKNLPLKKQNYAKKVLNRICNCIFGVTGDACCPLIDVHQMHVPSEDDALEMFIRFNNGGKPLSKVDIVSSILTSCWPEADDCIRTIIEYKESTKKKKGKDDLDLEYTSYNDFGLGFIVRAAMVLFSNNIQSSISNDVIDCLRKNWEKFKSSLTNMELLLLSINRLKVKSFRNRWNVLLPIFYLVYYNSNYRECKDGVQAYLSRAILLKYFQNGTIAKLTKLRKMMNDNAVGSRPVLTLQMVDNFPDLEVTEEKIEKILKTPKDNVFAYYALELLSSSWMRAGNEYDVDHLHPKEGFNINPVKGISFFMWNQWQNMCNLLPNLELLNTSRNKSKNAESLATYISHLGAMEKKEFVEQAMIIDDSGNELPTELEDFGTFFEKRKKILHDKLCDVMIYKPKKDIFAD